MTGNELSIGSIIGLVRRYIWWEWNLSLIIKRKYAQNCVFFSCSEQHSFLWIRRRLCFNSLRAWRVFIPAAWKLFWSKCNINLVVRHGGRWGIWCPFLCRIDKSRLWEVYERRYFYCRLGYWSKPTPIYQLTWIDRCDSAGHFVHNADQSSCSFPVVLLSTGQTRWVVTTVRTMEVVCGSFWKTVIKKLCISSIRFFVFGAHILFFDSIVKSIYKRWRWRHGRTYRSVKS